MGHHRGSSEIPSSFATATCSRRPGSPRGWIWRWSDLQGWISEHLDEDLSVPMLARRAGMSPRNFARAFRREIGMTPAAYVEAQRVETARRLLESTGRSVAEVAQACGFSRVETIHRAFRRVLRIAPGQYRRHFKAS